jgi:glycerol-3-phosphate dehydrogenase
MLSRISDPHQVWDFIVVGGGATGIGVVIEAASRGYRTLLLEQGDFARGTSSRSTKLIHGGVRYLRQGRVSLVTEALGERELLRRNAPHLVHELPFVIPAYAWWEAPLYGLGLRLYDVLARSGSFETSKSLTREKTLELLPTLQPEGLRGGILYSDGQFDDARLAVNMAQTAADLGGAVLNYVRVVKLLKAGGQIQGVAAKEIEVGNEFEIKAKIVINATGPFTDTLRRMDDLNAKPMIRPSQGAHIVLPKEYLPGEAALMVPRTDDGRVLFAIPWHGRVVVGTTDTPIAEIPVEPRAKVEELDFLISHAARYLTRRPEPAAILSTFVGIRPLVGSNADTASASRDHTLHVADSSLVTITGGKWTTYRKMGEDTIDRAGVLAGLDERASVTSNLRLHGSQEDTDPSGDLRLYGTDAVAVRDLIWSQSGYDEPIHPNLTSRVGEVVWAARNEMARTVEDFLARRSRSLFLDARSSIDAAPMVARIMAEELGRDRNWEREQVRGYQELARGYLAD